MQSNGAPQYLSAADYDRLEQLLFKAIKNSIEAREFVFELQVNLDPGVNKVGFDADFATGIVKIFIDPPSAKMSTDTALHLFHQLPLNVSKAHLRFLKKQNNNK